MPYAGSGSNNFSPMISLITAVLALALTLQTPTAPYSVSGRVLDAADGAPVGYADVIVSGAPDRRAVSVTEADGSFTVGDIAFTSAVVEVRMLGYAPFVSDTLALKAGAPLELGDILLVRADNGIEGVTVVAEKNRIVYKLDRRTISASSALNAAGGTALDVLAGTPSVLVDAEGNLTLRGSGNYLVYVDGKPSPLDGSAALQQIPAADIDDIEIITTPSARYKSDGDVGIINIRTVGTSGEGFGGVVNLAGGTLGTWSADGKLSYRKGNNLWYAGGTFQDLKSTSDFRQDKTTVVDGVTTQSRSDGYRYRNNGTFVGNVGWQFDNGTHSLALDLQAGKTRNHRGGYMLYNDAFNSEDHYILAKTLFQYSLNYVWKIGDRSELSASSRLRYDSYSIEYTESNMFTLAGVRDEGTRGYEEEHHWDADGSLAYSLDYSATGRFEAGYQYTTYSEHGGYHFKYWDKSVGDFVWDETNDIPFYYRRQVHSLYAMATDRIGVLDFDAGLRADRVIDVMDIAVVDASRHIRRFNLFPSAHISYDASPAGTFSLGFSRRTNRPGIWQLEPYITYEDYHTRKRGNPDVLPEYVGSLELGWRKSFAQGASMAATAFWRHRKDVVDWARQPYQAGITMDQIVNAGDQDECGVEFSGTLKPFDWWNSSLNGDVYYHKFVSKRRECTDSHGLNYMLGWINNFTVAKRTRIQFDSHFVGPHSLTQGSEKAYCFFDLAASRQLLKGRMTLSLVAHDVFHTAVYQSLRQTTDLISSTVVRPRYPNLILSMTFRFNSAAAKEKSGAISGDAGFEGKEF